MKPKEKTTNVKNIEDDEEYIQLQKELTILNEKREEKLKLIKKGDHSEEAKKEAREIVEQEIAIMKRMSVIEMIYNLDDWAFDFKNHPKEATITLLVIIIISLILVWIFTYFHFFHFFFNFIPDQ